MAHFVEQSWASLVPIRIESFARTDSVLGDAPKRDVLARSWIEPPVSNRIPGCFDEFSKSAGLKTRLLNSSKQLLGNFIFRRNSRTSHRPKVDKVFF
jgi:hypothetical protein